MFSAHINKHEMLIFANWRMSWFIAAKESLKIFSENTCWSECKIIWQKWSPGQTYK